jgi:hypothetical protein
VLGGRVPWVALRRAPRIGPAPGFRATDPRPRAAAPAAPYRCDIGSRRRCFTGNLGDRLPCAAGGQSAPSHQASASPARPRLSRATRQAVRADTNAERAFPVGRPAAARLGGRLSIPGIARPGRPHLLSAGRSEPWRDGSPGHGDGAHDRRTRRLRVPPEGKRRQREDGCCLRRFDTLSNDGAPRRWRLVE